jgi:hypothetical protein
MIVAIYLLLHKKEEDVELLLEPPPMFLLNHASILLPPEPQYIAGYFWRRGVGLHLNETNLRISPKDC